MKAEELALAFVSMIEQDITLSFTANKAVAFYTVNDEARYLPVMLIDHGGDKVKAAMAAIKQALSKKKEMEHAKGAKT